MSKILYNCCKCKKDFKESELCEHSHDIIYENAGRFRYDDMAMCPKCCEVLQDLDYYCEDCGMYFTVDTYDKHNQDTGHDIVAVGAID